MKLKLEKIDYFVLGWLVTSLILFIVGVIMLLNAKAADPAVQLDSNVYEEKETAYQIPDLCGLEVIHCDQEIYVGVGGGDGNNMGAVREVTAYTSRPEETDETPCIGADGTDICERYAQGELICASNAFALGTKITVDHYGTCTVADRMNRRFTNRVDVYFGTDLNRAIAFGRQNLYVE